MKDILSEAKFGLRHKNVRWARAKSVRSEERDFITEGAGSRDVRRSLSGS